MTIYNIFTNPFVEEFGLRRSGGEMTDTISQTPRDRIFADTKTEETLARAIAFCCSRVLPPFSPCFCRCSTCGKEGAFWDPVHGRQAEEVSSASSWARTSLLSESSSCGTYIRYGGGRVYRRPGREEERERRRERRERMLANLPVVREVGIGFLLLIQVASLPLRVLECGKKFCGLTRSLFSLS